MVSTNLTSILDIVPSMLGFGGKKVFIRLPKLKKWLHISPKNKPIIGLWSTTRMGMIKLTIGQKRHLTAQAKTGRIMSLGKGPVSKTTKL